MFRLLPVLLLPTVLFAQPSHKLVIISIDGFDSRFLTDPALHVKIPNIRKLVRTGVSASVKGITGSEPGAADLAMVNGITGPGLKVGSVLWPMPSGTEATFYFPSAPKAAGAATIPFDAVAQKVTPPDAMRKIEAMFPAVEKQLWDDSSSSSAAIWLLTTPRPDLVMIRMTDLAAEQHEAGALSIYAREALENEDDLVGQIVAKIPAGTMIAVVSDHGVENGNYFVRPRVLLKQTGKTGDVEVADGLIGTTDAGVAEHLRKLMKDGHRHGLAREVPLAEVQEREPALKHWVAAFDTLPNYVAIAEERGPALGPGTHQAVSGLWPTRPAYRSVFILAGAGIAAKKLGEIEMLQIAPTLADILGVKLPETKMKSLWPIISR